MALLSKRDFAEKTGQTTKTLSTYIIRNKIDVEDNGLIDTNSEKNRSFMVIHSNGAKKKEPKTIALKEGVIDNDLNIGNAIASEYMALDASEIMKKHYEAIQKKKAVVLQDLEIDKLKGQVIPSELIKPLFQQHNQSILAEFKNMMDEQLRFISKQHGLNVVQVSEIKGKWIEGLNSAISRAKSATIKGIDNIINNYSEK